MNLIAPRLRRATTFRRAGWLAVASMVGLALAGPGAGIASASPSDATGHKVTICHRTNSVTNPYVLITVDYSGADGSLVHDNGNGDHTNHLGPIFDFSADPSVAYPPPHNGDQWGDIIPMFSWTGDSHHQGGGTYPGMNWTTEGQAILNAGCDSSTKTTTSTTTSTSDTSTGTTSVGTTSTGTTSVGTTSTGTTSVGTTSVGTTSVGTTSVGTTPVGTTSVGTTPVGTTLVGITGTTVAPRGSSSNVLGVTSSPKFTGAVEGATSNPRVTPPPTDTLPISGTPGGDTWRLFLVGLAALGASLLLLSPRASTAERNRR